MDLVAIIQARMGSTRLPGKVAKEVLGKPLLLYELERVKRARKLDKIVVATSTDPKDARVVQLAREAGVEVFRGSEDNVLERYYQCAKEFGAKRVVRITGDCPLIDPDLIDATVIAFETSNSDYLSNCFKEKRTYPRGMDTEVFTFDALERAYKEHTTSFEEEHVTPYIYNHPNLFRLGYLANTKDHQHIRLTVDTPEDFELIRIIIEKLYPKNPKMPLEAILDYLEKNPELLKINAHVQQKA